MKKILEWLKTAIAAWKAARTLYTMILLLLASLGYLGVDKLSSDTVEAVESKLETIKAVKPAKDCTLIIKEEISKSNKSHSREYHGGS